MFDYHQEWSNTYHKASIAIQDREQKIEEAALLIENNLRLLGATAIEDKLQVYVCLCHLELFEKSEYRPCFMYGSVQFEP